VIPGKWFVLADGKRYLVPPLTFLERRQLDEEGVSKQMVGDDAKQAAVAMFATVHRALVRNHPEAKLEDIEALLDPGLTGPLLTWLLGRWKPEERTTEAPAGNPPAGQ
jgi:hypothetical protein